MLVTTAHVFGLNVTVHYRRTSNDTWLNVTGTIPNALQYLWQVPADLLPGKRYQLRLQIVDSEGNMTDMLGQPVLTEAISDYSLNAGGLIHPEKAGRGV